MKAMKHLNNTTTKHLNQNNVLRLCDGCEALGFSVWATCTKPLLAAALID